MLALLRIKLADYIAAAVPVLASITLDHLNGVIAAIGGLLGIAYLLWKWRREAMHSPLPHFPISRHEKTHQSQENETPHSPR
ncbi:hypothetical protein Ga0100231_023310 [Opitutaceae bacterium TAV4]|uniref:hypothetical protein n=1 Tax=Geminisphaera colitermitum TaxID=1148786 RepID=UPI000158CB8A|nr:hypothetical protein [Geminisphaera colitermitum]RRJ96716.1 hypothetical protein Ga0100231_023310 [Opitutaceae bacterium TAV4]RRK02428.1 hypothetical protein Ga0100230_004595 [Opitutaceae bacterium TAV3]